MFLNVQQRYFYSYCMLTGKYLVFFFYPLDFTFVCPTEILAFNDRVEEFRKLGAEVRASKCSQFNSTILIVNPGGCLLSWLPFHPSCLDGDPQVVVKLSIQLLTVPPRTEGGLGKLDIPLLSDLTHAISKDYGVYLEENGHTLRGLFIIDPEGTLRSPLLCLGEITSKSINKHVICSIRQITMNDLPVGRSVDETLRLVQVK